MSGPDLEAMLLELAEREWTPRLLLHGCGDNPWLAEAHDRRIDRRHRRPCVSAVGETPLGAVSRLMEEVGDDW